jgi:hypothetical protein
MPDYRPAEYWLMADFAAGDAAQIRFLAIRRII